MDRSDARVAETTFRSAVRRAERTIRSNRPGVDGSTRSLAELISTDAETTFTPGWLSGIDAAFARHPLRRRDRRALPRRGRPAVGGTLYSTLLFGTVNLVKRLTGRVVYVSATNIAVRSSAWTGYDTRLTQGGDELDLLRRLQAAGEVAFDVTNPTRTSSRRLDEGLLYNVAVTFLYYYLLGYTLNRTFRRPVLGTAPPFRRPGDRGRERIAGDLHDDVIQRPETCLPHKSPGHRTSTAPGSR